MNSTMNDVHSGIFRAEANRGGGNYERPHSAVKQYNLDAWKEMGMKYIYIFKEYQIQNVLHFKCNLNTICLQLNTMQSKVAHMLGTSI